MATATNVSTGKPKIGGGVFRAPMGTAVPTDASTALEKAFVSQGYCSEEGLTNSNKRESGSIKAWGGDTVHNYTKSKEDTFKFVLIEAKSEETLKTVHGDSNVTGTLKEGIAVQVNGEEMPDCVWVFDMILRGNALKRITVPNASVTEVGDVVYKDDQAIAYEVTITAKPDNKGNTHYEYIKEATA